MGNDGNSKSDLKCYAHKQGVKFWEIAERLGVNDGNFSRLLRKELSEEKKAEIKNIIDIIALERK